MPVTIPYLPSEPDSYIIITELSSGRNLTFDLLPVLRYIEQYFNSDTIGYQDIDNLTNFLLELKTSYPELADHALSIMNLALKHCRVQI